MKRDKWDKNQIFPSALETMTWSGKTWAMMQHPDIVFLWIGVSLLEENGVDGKFVPQTWPQLEEMANKLTKSRGDGWEFVGFLPHIGQAWQYRAAPGQRGEADLGRRQEGPAGHGRGGGGDRVRQEVRHPPGGRAGDRRPGASPSPAGTTGPRERRLGAGDIFGQKQMAFINGGNWYADNVRRANRRLGQQTEVQRGPHPQRPPRPARPEDQRLQRGHPGGGAQGRAEARSDVGVHEVHRHQGGRDHSSSATPRTSPRTRKRRAIPRITGDPDTGIGAQGVPTPSSSRGSGRGPSSTRR